MSHHITKNYIKTVYVELKYYESPMKYYESPISKK